MQDKTGLASAWNGPIIKKQLDPIPCWQSQPYVSIINLFVA